MEFIIFAADLDLAKEPNWIVTLFLGAAVGAVFGSYSQLWNLLTFVYRRFFVVMRYEGTWYSYHWTYIQHEPKIVFSIVDIRKGIWSPYRFKLTQRGTNLIYKGTGRVEGSHLIFNFRATGHEERTICRFQDILTSLDVTAGLWLSYDHDKNVASGAIILSQNEIPAEDIERTIRSSFKRERDSILIHVQTKKRGSR
ncbi:hypothetical protein L0663_05055 [Dyadobacter sp. CY107]|uniref:hypothetical protein n=1 Tax=Dyadobacter fanqingshengii TaxID=2906443 RepID=UPI001F1A6EE7|nr:hypothetical protein [Dyadobacter fanqingshengii]MCF2502735.1 hypothetical protein [Dyadobacter fanqingshengii]